MLCRARRLGGGSWRGMRAPHLAETSHERTNSVAGNPLTSRTYEAARPRGSESLSRIRYILRVAKASASDAAAGLKRKREDE